MSLVGFKAQNHPQQVVKPSVDDRGTTPEVFDALHERFRFTIDVAASPKNTKLPRFYSLQRCMWATAGECGRQGCLGCEYGGAGSNGLSSSWVGERVWCNPPYSDIEPWVIKAAQSQAEIVVMLLPANRTEQRWWQRHIEPFRDGRSAVGPRVEFLPGRMRFIVPPADRVLPNDRPPFGCCLVIWERP